MRLHHEDGPSFAPDGRVSPAQPGPESHPGLNVQPAAWTQRPCSPWVQGRYDRSCRANQAPRAPPRPPPVMKRWSWMGLVLLWMGGVRRVFRRLRRFAREASVHPTGVEEVSKLLERDFV
eukprot:CAMPEP_0180186046 /NCGR_PEP_ID=MMETSP0986-20121125/42742_1 /TAXON_ID=697907 /ORGANISM="non described non described, Strain CCMP2293" /LENGTH=119 /DNA_ID=CAMNT_0022139959 /DNA_START=44 /DNA_END=404 /DNA_ORIENTATION=-